MALSLIPAPAKAGTTFSAADDLTGIPLETITFDATLDETVSQGVDFTEFPVESGRAVSDHGVVQQPTASFSGVISLTSLDPTVLPDPLRLGNIFDSLLKMAEDKQPVTVVDGLMVLFDYYITNVSISRDSAGGGNQMIVQIDLKKIRIVDSLKIEIPASILRAAKRAAGTAAASAGTQSGVPTSATAAAGPSVGGTRSWGKAGADFLTGG